MRNLTLLLLFLTAYGHLSGQYFYEVYLDNVVQGSCSTPSEYIARIITDDPTNQNYKLKVYWQDGKMDSVSSIPFSSGYYDSPNFQYIFDSINVSHLHLVQTNYYEVNRIDLFIEGANNVLTSSSNYQSDFYKCIYINKHHCVISYK